MRVRTITCHDVYNAGAKLQSLALMRWFENRGHQVEIIDYRPYYLTSAYKLFGINNPRYRSNPLLALVYIIGHLPKKIKMLTQRKAYDRFSAEYLRYTQRRYTTYEELCDNPPQAELFVAGSDQIWNPLFPNGRDFSYYLGFAKNGLKCSYAASFATPTIGDKYKSLVTSYLENLDYISVRETSGLNILNECGISGGRNVVDPVFLFSKTEWLNMLPIKDINEDYILVYDFDGSQEVKHIAQKLAAKNNSKIYTIQDLPYSDKVLNNIDPIGFLSYIIGARTIISNSFHATAFSLIFHKDFWVVKRKENINTRMADVLSMVDLPQRIIDDTYNLSEAEPINWTNVDALLNTNIAQSTLYLEQIEHEAKK